MAKTARANKKSQTRGGLLTLSEVSKRTGISMPTLQRYKKLYQDRIPSEGEGRKQRYPKSSLAVFKQIKKENIGKRGRPRKAAAERALPPKKTRKTATKTTRRASSTPEGLLTLSRIGEMTGISYPTLVRYVKLHLDKLPHEGEGRKRRFHPEAVPVFEELRASSPRGPRKGQRRGKGPARVAREAAAAATAVVRENLPKEAERRIRELEQSYGRLQKKFDALVKKLQKPLVR